MCRIACELLVVAIALVLDAPDYIHQVVAVHVAPFVENFRFNLGPVELYQRPDISKHTRSVFCSLGELPTKLEPNRHPLTSELWLT